MSLLPLTRCDGCHQYIRKWVTISYARSGAAPVEAHVCDGPDRDTIRCLERALSAYIRGELSPSPLQAPPAKLEIVGWRDLYDDTFYSAIEFTGTDEPGMQPLYAAVNGSGAGHAGASRATHAEAGQK